MVQTLCCSLGEAEFGKKVKAAVLSEVTSRYICELLSIEGINEFLRKSREYFSDGSRDRHP